MAYHVPFAHRRRPPGPIYIGFEEPVSIQKRKGRFNWAGFNGLLLSLISPLTLFLLAPVALLFSLAGLRRKPRGMAVFGLILSLAGTAVLGIGVTRIANERAIALQRRQAIFAAELNRPLIEDTRKTLDEVTTQVREYRSANDNYLPDLEEGMMMTVQFRDAWDRELFYEPFEEGCRIRSAGPDGEFLNGDDVFVEVAGRPDDRPVQ